MTFWELAAKCDSLCRCIISHWSKQKQSVTCTSSAFPSYETEGTAKQNCNVNLTQSIWPPFRNCRKWNEKWDKECLPAFHTATVAKETAFLASTCPPSPFHIFFRVFENKEIKEGKDEREWKSELCQCRQSPHAVSPFSPLSRSPRIFATWQNPSGTQITELDEKVNKTIGSPIWHAAVAKKLLPHPNRAFFPAGKVGSNS